MRHLQIVQTSLECQASYSVDLREYYRVFLLRFRTWMPHHMVRDGFETFLGSYQDYYHEAFLGSQLLATDGVNRDYYQGLRICNVLCENINVCHVSHRGVRNSLHFLFFVLGPSAVFEMCLPTDPGTLTNNGPAAASVH